MIVCALCIRDDLKIAYLVRNQTHGGLQGPDLALFPELDSPSNNQPSSPSSWKAIDLGNVSSRELRKARASHPVPPEEAGASQLSEPAARGEFSGQGPCVHLFCLPFHRLALPAHLQGQRLYIPGLLKNCP